tara:strand:- start:206 stop:1477 length:1272 start_codon:yes stop_codon:yes gene_type:complete
MAFSLAGFIGGAATQGLKDIEEEELRVKKFYEKELDRSVAEQREMRKDRRKKVESRMEQITMLESFFGGDPQARNMAAKVVAGGSANVNMVLNTLQQARKNGASQADMFKAVQFIPDKDAPNQSFETAKDAAESITELVKPADIGGLSTAASKQSKGLFSMAVNKDKIFNTMVKEYQGMGELKNEPTEKVTQALKGQLKIDFSQLPQEVKSLDQTLNQVSSKISKLDKDSPAYQTDLDTLTNEKKRIIGLMNEKAVALEGTPTDSSASISVLGTNLNNTIADAEKQIGYDKTKKTAILNGKLVAVGDAIKLRNKVVDEAKKNYLLTLVDGAGRPLNSKAKVIIDTRLSTEYKELVAKLSGKKEPTVVEKKEEAQNKEVDIATNLGSPEAYINDARKRGASDAALRVILSTAYPNADLNKLLKK